MWIKTDKIMKMHKHCIWKI